MVVGLVASNAQCEDNMCVAQLAVVIVLSLINDGLRFEEGLMPILADHLLELVWATLAFDLNAHRVLALLLIKKSLALLADK